MKGLCAPPNTTTAASTATVVAATANTKTTFAEQARTNTCVYCSGWHLYDECPTNPVSVNYVGNFNRNNNPYSNTYNPGGEITPISHGEATNKKKI